MPRIPDDLGMSHNSRRALTPRGWRLKLAAVARWFHCGHFCASTMRGSGVRILFAPQHIGPTKLVANSGLGHFEICPSRLGAPVFWTAADRSFSIL